MHGNHLDRPYLSLARLAQEGDIGTVHALETVLEGDLTGKGHAHAALELRAHPGLPEPGRHDDARAIEDGDLEDVQAPTRLLLDDLVNGARDGNELADGGSCRRLDIG